MSNKWNETNPCVKLRNLVFRTKTHNNTHNNKYNIMILVWISINK